MSDRPTDRRLLRRLIQFSRTHPRHIALMRLALFLLALPALGLIGAIWSATPPVVYDAQKNCEYSAVEASAHPYAARVATNSRFWLSWHIAYTGSCDINGVKLGRQSDAIPSLAPGFPLVTDRLENSQPAYGTQIILTAKTLMAMPAGSGVYETKWQLYTPSGEKFGPIISRRVQTYGPDTPPPPLIPDQVPPSLLQQVLTALVSFVFHLMPALVAIAFVLWRATDFMNKLFGLKAPATARRHVMSMMFGIMTSFMRVTNGKIDHTPENTAAETIGGPAWLIVSDYSAALIERGGGFARIVGPGFTYLQSHERVRGAVDLQTQHRTVPEKTLTKDGLPVEVDVEMGFRITEKDLPADVPPEAPRLSLINRVKRRLGLRVSPALLEASRPHRFSREAVRRAIYETPVVSSERPPDWAFSFSNIRAGDISDQLSEKRFDEVNSPDDPDRHPLRDIVTQGLKDAREVAARQGLGIDMIDMTMGMIKLQKEYREVVSEQKKEYRDPLIEQIITNWRAEWSRRATVLEAQGDAKRLQLLEEARAEAQANMIQALTEGFRIATSDSDSKTISNEVIALRFIDTLEALLKKPPEKEKSDEKPPDKQAKGSDMPDTSAFLRTIFGQS